MLLSTLAPFHFRGCFVFVGFDTETFLIRPGLLFPRLVCLSVFADGAAGLHDAADGVDRALSWLADPAVVLVAHNAAFDLGVLIAAAFNRGPDVGREMLHGVFNALESGRVRDTMIREKLIAVAEGRREFDPLARKPASFSLDTLVSRYLGVDISADKKDPTAWRLRYSELADTPVAAWPQAARDYAISDARYALDVFRAQGRGHRSCGGHVLVDECGNVTDEGPQTAAAFALTLMSSWGVRTDPDAVETWSAEIESAVDAGVAVGRAAGFVRPDGSVNTAALRARVEAAYHARGEQPGTTDGGKTSTDRDTLAGSGDPALVDYAASGFAKKQAATYLPVARVGTAIPVCGSYDTIRETGRTSMYQPNLQNPPRGGGYRACFVPRPGFLFCSVDYDTAELRALAQMHLWWFGRSTMADALKAGRDLHLDLAADLLGIPYADAVARKGEKAIKATRQLAKVANFGFPGGLGARAFVSYAGGQGVAINEHHDTDGRPSAARLREAWFAKWPEMTLYFDQIAGLTRFGAATVKQAQSGRVRGDVGFTQAANGFFQGLVADWAKAALWAVSVASYTGRDVLRAPEDGPPPGGASPLLGCRPVLFLHDEVIAEVPEDRADICAREMARVMCAAAQPYAPDVPIKASPALMRRWYKGAEPTYNAHGLLVPWSPEVST